MENSIDPIRLREALQNIVPVEVDGRKGYQCELPVKGRVYVLTYFPGKGETHSRANAVKQLSAQIAAVVGISNEVWEDTLKFLTIDLNKKQAIGNYLQKGKIKQQNLRERFGSVTSKQRKIDKLFQQIKPQPEIASERSVIPRAERLIQQTMSPQTESLKRSARLEKLHREYQQNRSSYLRESVLRYQKAWNHLDKGKDAATIQAELYSSLNTMREKFEIKQKALFEKIKMENQALANIWNSEINDPAVRDSIKKAIHAVNAMVAKEGMAHNSAKMVQGRVADFQAVVDKRLKIAELEAKGELTESEQELLHTLTKEPSNRSSLEKAYRQLGEAAEKLSGKKLRSQLKKIRGIETKLATQPDTAIMQKWGRHLEEELQKNPEMLDTDRDSKWRSKAPGELAWGQNFLNYSLTNPANWINHRSAAILLGKDYRAHVSVSELENLNISSNGGVPAGLRKAEGFDERATNFIRSTIYQLNDAGYQDPSTTFVSYRGGQFPTVAAAKEAIQTILRETGGVTALHINSLLTPTTFTFIKKDLLLLEAHRQNILTALDELNELDIDRSKLVFSNIGVNEGAVGEMKILGVRPPSAGWHSSVAHTNEGAVQLNKTVQEKFDPYQELDITFMDRLGPLVQVGQDLEAVWASNDFANASVGNNQFKLPALWKTFDSLLGVTSYTNCMSGKDRTGQVESSAHHMLQEISMGIAEHKKNLERVVDSFERKSGIALGLNEKRWLTCACFTEQEVRAILTDQDFYNALKFGLQNKRSLASKALGGADGLLVEKIVIGRRILPGLMGISTNTPLKDTEEAAEAAQSFPALAATSVYDEGNPVRRHREAYNRRLQIQMGGSIQVTEMNTARSGFKVEGGESLDILVSGFDREYVLSQLANRPEAFADLVGLHEFDENTQTDLIDEMNRAETQAEKEKVLCKVESLKLETLSPQAVVSA